MNQIAPLNDYSAYPDPSGRFGDYGGRYVPETLMPLVHELEAAFRAAIADPAFQRQLDGYLKHYVGRPSPLYFAERWGDQHGLAHCEAAERLGEVEAHAARSFSSLATWFSLNGEGMRERMLKQEIDRLSGGR